MSKFAGFTPAPVPNPRVVLKREEVAQQLRCSPSKVSALFHGGELTGVKSGRLLRFEQSDLDAYLERQRAACPANAAD